MHALAGRWARRAGAWRCAHRDRGAVALHRIDPALFSPRGDGQKRFRRGRLIHGLLERLPELAPDKREAAALAWLKRQGAEEDGAEAFTREALSVINDARFAAVFSPKAAPRRRSSARCAARPFAASSIVSPSRRSRACARLSKPTGQRRRTPRDAPDSYVMQLALYREVLRKIFPGKTVILRTALDRKAHISWSCRTAAWTLFSLRSPEVESLTGAPYIHRRISRFRRSKFRGHQQSFRR
jgi:hypothetical protein